MQIIYDICMYMYIYMIYVIHEAKMTLLGDEQMSNGWPSFLLNDEQIRNCLGVVRTSQDFLDPLLFSKKLPKFKMEPNNITLK